MPPNLTSPWLASLQQQGYVYLHSFFTANETDELRESLQQCCTADEPAGLGIEHIHTIPYVFSVQHLLQRGGHVFLSLLAHPGLAEVIHLLAGKDGCLTQDFAVIKNLGSTQEVAWHRDLVTGSPNRGYMIGIYLDDAAPGEGALEVIPGSHLTKADICTAIQQPKVFVPAAKGAVVIHDLELTHCSGMLHQLPVRRVIYLEVMPAALMNYQGWFSDRFFHCRQELFTLAKNLQHPGLHQRMHEIHAAREAPAPAQYCIPSG